MRSSAPTETVPMCLSCRNWRPDILAFPDEPKPGSMRICARGEQTSAHSWKPCWEPRTAGQQDRLF
jgi:hypothetical protein